MTSSHFLGFLKVLSVCSSSIFGFVEPRSHIYLALGTPLSQLPIFFLTPRVPLRSPVRSPPGKGKETSATQASRALFDT